MSLINRIGGGGADVSGVTATADSVAKGLIFVNSKGEEEKGQAEIYAQFVFGQVGTERFDLWGSDDHDGGCACVYKLEKSMFMSKDSNLHCWLPKKGWIEAYQRSDYCAAADVRIATPTNDGSLVLSNVEFEPRYAVCVMAHRDLNNFDISQHGAIFYLFYDKESAKTRYPITFMHTMNSRYFTANLSNVSSNSPICVYDESEDTFTFKNQGSYYFLSGFEYLCTLIY